MKEINILFSQSGGGRSKLRMALSHEGPRVLCLPQYQLNQEDFILTWSLSSGWLLELSHYHLITVSRKEEGEEVKRVHSFLMGLSGIHRQLLSSHPVRKNLVTWPCLAAKEAGEHNVSWVHCCHK